MFETDHEVQAIDPEDCGSFAMRLFHARSSIPLTQEELAARAGIPGGATAIGHYEAGRREPGLENLRRLVWALGESADYLLTTRWRTDDPYRPQGCAAAERTGVREQREWEASYPEAAGHLPSSS
jgi:transcriptional regulator with XRE-family HTH domain